VSKLQTGSALRADGRRDIGLGHGQRSVETRGRGLPLIVSPAFRRRGCCLATVVALALLGASPALAAPADAGPAPALAGVRMPFLANGGQMDPQVVYYTPTFAGTVFVTRQGELVYALRARSRHSGGARIRVSAAPTSGWTLTETLAGGRPQPTAGLPTETQVSLFLGADPAGHRVVLPTYASVRLGEVWPGIEVTLNATGGSVEKHFTVNPDGSPALIRVLGPIPHRDGRGSG